METLRMF